MSDVSPDETDELRAALTSMGAIGPAEDFRAAKLSGGVSCDVWRIDIPRGTFCLKRALSKLRVAADWRAPPERASSEVAWMQLAVQIVPGIAPAIYAVDPERHMFAMQYFPPEQYPVWKSQLQEGTVASVFASAVGEALARIHAATAGRADVATAFANDAQFLALRLDPFLLYTAERHGEVADELRAIAQDVAAARIALMHGDVSPKNILAGPGGPVFLDAETACYGDPAFDLAFCLNHLLLKSVWHPEWQRAYLSAFGEMVASYGKLISWEDPVAFEARTARILPALMLARVDGKSPAEYLADRRKGGFVRATALELLKHNPMTLGAVVSSWATAHEHEFADAMTP